MRTWRSTSPDLERAAQFYGDALGFTRVSQFDHQFAMPPDAPTTRRRWSLRARRIADRLLAALTALRSYPGGHSVPTTSRPSARRRGPLCEGQARPVADLFFADGPQLTRHLRTGRAPNDPTIALDGRHRVVLPEEVAREVGDREVGVEVEAGPFIPGAFGAGADVAEMPLLAERATRGRL